MEYEVKIPVDDLSKVEDALRKAGAKLEAHLKETDYYVDLRQCNGVPKDSALRVRKTVNLMTGETKGKITCKTTPPGTLGGVKVREEIESEVSDPDAVVKAFMKLGFLVIRVSKERKVYAGVEGATVTLDNVEGLGNFVEVEVMNPEGPEDYVKRLNRIVNLLGLQGRPTITKPYIQLLRERLGK